MGQNILTRLLTTFEVPFKGIRPPHCLERPYCILTYISPTDRVTFSGAFTYKGNDYAWPSEIKNYTVRARFITKGYGCVIFHEGDSPFFYKFTSAHMYTFEELTLLSKIEAYLNSRSSTQYLKGLRGDDMVVVKQENLPSSSMAQQNWFCLPWSRWPHSERRQARGIQSYLLPSLPGNPSSLEIQEVPQTEC